MVVCIDHTTHLHSENTDFRISLLNEADHHLAVFTVDGITVVLLHNSAEGTGFKTQNMLPLVLTSENDIALSYQGTHHLFERLSVIPKILAIIDVTAHRQSGFLGFTDSI